MKQVMKCVKMWFCLLAALFIFSAMPVKADAAEYKKVNVSIYTNSARTKVGKYYFWSSLNRKAGKLMVYSSKSATGKGTVLFSTVVLDGFHWLLTNGSKVYCVSDTSQKKHVIYSMDATGKNQKKWITLSGNKIYLENVYGANIYFTKYSGSGQMLCSLSTKTKKVKTLIKNGYTYSGANERYMCTRVESSKKVTVQIYDCKKCKVKKKYTVKKTSSENIGISELTKNYFYITVSGLESTKIYRCSKDGTKSLALFKTIKGAADVRYINDSYIYYANYDENVQDYKYYRMTIKNKKIKEITMKAYEKVLGITD